MLPRYHHNHHSIANGKIITESLILAFIGGKKVRLVSWVHNQLASHYSPPPIFLGAQQQIWGMIIEARSQRWINDHRYPVFSTNSFYSWAENNLSFFSWPRVVQHFKNVMFHLFLWALLTLKLQGGVLWKNKFCPFFLFFTWTLQHDVILLSDFLLIWRDISSNLLSRGDF